MVTLWHWPPPKWAFSVALAVKKPACQCKRHETGFQSLGQEDPLEEAMQPSPVFLPGESHGQRSLAGYSLWGHTESRLKQLSTTQHNVADKMRSTVSKWQILVEESRSKSIFCGKKIPLFDLCNAESFMEVNWHSFSSKWETLSVGFQLVFIFFNIKSMV